MEIGYTLSSEERQPQELVRAAQMAESIGFPYALMSDHFHPWTDKQGSSPFVWAVLGAIAATTIAQASATIACLMPGRFFLGVGSGESLKEHITGQMWPPPEMRQDMLEEAVEVLRLLHRGTELSHPGKFFQVHDARVYDIPEESIPIYLAAGGEQSAKLAGRIGDGLICPAPSAESVRAFEGESGSDKPRMGQLTVCWARTEEEALRTAHEYWPISGLEGQFKHQLPRPAYLEQASKLVTPEKIREEIVCGPDPQRHLDGIAEFVKAGFDHVYVHQVGPDQEGFMRFYEREILPNAGAIAA